MKSDQSQSLSEQLAAVKELARLSSLELPSHLTYAPWTRVSFESGYSVEVNGNVLVLEPSIFCETMERLHPLLKVSLDTSTITNPDSDCPANSIAILLLKILFSKRAILSSAQHTSSKTDRYWWDSVSQLTSFALVGEKRHLRPTRIMVFDTINRRQQIEATTPSSLSASVEYFDIRDSSDDVGSIISRTDNALVVLLLPNHYDQIALNINRMLIEVGTPFLRCGLGITSFECGPLVIPGSTPCLECLWRRRLGTQPLLQRFAEGVDWPVIPESPLDFVFFGFLWLEVLRIITDNQSPSTIGHIAIGDPMRSSVRRCRILRLPRCSVCG